MGDPVRFKAVVEYDGSGFAGYQRQPEPYRTVQAELEQVISQLARKDVTVYGSGRTDSGVHATGQVIAFDLEWKHRPENLLRAMNANLPEDVAIRAVEAVARDFNPRFHAKRRAYEYIIERCDQRARRPLTRRRKWQVFVPLDLREMNRASSLLVGTHDFLTFGLPPQGNNSVRDLFVAEWRESGPDLIFRIEATAFLYRMVRSIVGSLKQVGEGRWSLEQFENAFKACNRAASAGAAPAHGLYLVKVMY